MKINLNDKAKLIFEILEKNGFECFAVGGCVRDSILGRDYNDFDFTTNATPDQIQQCFSSFTTIDIGKEYGTICVVIGSCTFEITTYRTDGDYTDSRHPETVSFSDNLADDLSRRDFTINALAYNEKTGVIDLFGGLTDLEYGTIRCIGDADTRFAEDALRILRALRFASTYGFSIEQSTSTSILKNKDKLLLITPERINCELSKLLCGKNADFILRRYKQVIFTIIPELSATYNFYQESDEYNKDLYNHLISGVKNVKADLTLRLAMLLHDIGKPMTATSGFEGHSKLSAAMAKTILKRLRYPNSVVDTAQLLISRHNDKLKEESVMIKKYLRDIGIDNFRLLLQMQYANAMAKSILVRNKYIDNLTAIKSKLDFILLNKECFCLKDLAINGKDIMSMGSFTGVMIGQVLNELLNMVIEETVSNSKSELLEKAKDILNI